VAYAVGDTLCVCNLTMQDADKALKDKRFNHEVKP
jgi:hypothetical protein